MAWRRIEIQLGARGDAVEARGLARLARVIEPWLAEAAGPVRVTYGIERDVGSVWAMLEQGLGVEARDELAERVARDREKDAKAMRREEMRAYSEWLRADGSVECC
jgi:hypothetical protein